MYRNTYVEINVDNLKYNVETLVNGYKGYKHYIGVVKGNVYGHSEKVIRHLLASGINYLAVATLEEAMVIRKEVSDVPVLCMEPVSIKDIDQCILNNITVTIHDFEYFEKLLKKNLMGNLKVHIKVDSGMNRLGLNDKNDIKKVYENLKYDSCIKLEGIYTHFATSGISDKNWDKQLAKFTELVSLIDLASIPIVHLGRSLTLLNHNKIPFANGIRLGIVMYGYDQTPKKQSGIKATIRNFKNMYINRNLNISQTISKSPFTFKPAFSLYSEVVQVKKVNKGENVGYGLGYKATEDIYVAVVPIGYADGYSRSNKNGYVVINSTEYQIIGDIMMGMITVKVDETVIAGDKVTLIGEKISIQEVSKNNGTIIYEIMCSLNDWVPRVIIKNGKKIDIVEK